MSTRRFHVLAIALAVTMLTGCRGKEAPADLSKTKLQALFASSDAALSNGDNSQAQELLGQAVKLAETESADELDLVVALNKLAAFHQQRGRIAHSRVLFMRAVERTEPKVTKFLTTNEVVPSVWIDAAKQCLVGLADCYAEGGRSVDAIACYEKAVRIEDKQGKARTDSDSAWNRLSRVREADSKESQALMEATFWRSGRLPGQSDLKSTTRRKVDRLFRQRDLLGKQFEPQLLSIFREVASRCQPYDDDYRVVFELLVQFYKSEQPGKAVKLLEDDLKLHNGHPLSNDMALAEELDGLKFQTRDLYYLAFALRKLHRYREAIVIGEQALQAVKRVRGPDREFESGILDEIANCKEAIGHKADACAERKRQLELFRQDPRKRLAFSTLTLRLAHDCRAAHKLNESCEYCREVVQSPRDQNDKRTDLADALCCWCFNLIDLNKLEEAESLARQAVAVSKVSDDKLLKKNCLGLLALICAMRGHNEEARHLCAEALKFADDLPAKIAILQQSAMLNVQANRPAQAEQDYLKLLQVVAHSSADVHATVLEQLAELELKQGRAKEADRYFQSAIALAKAKHDSKLWLTLLRSMAGACVITSRNSQAQRLCESALNAELAEDATNRALLLEILAKSLAAQELYTEATKRYEEACNLVAQSKDPGKERVLAAMLRRRARWSADRDIDESIRCSKEAIKIFSAVDGAKSVNVSETFLQLGRWYLMDKQYDLAVTSVESAVENYKTIGDDKRLAGCYLELSDILIARQNFSEALAQLDRAIGLLQHIDTVDANEVLMEVRSHLIVVHNRRGEKQLADEQKKLLLKLWNGIYSGELAHDAMFTVHVADYLNMNNCLDIAEDLYHQAFYKYEQYKNPTDNLRITLLDHYCQLLRKQHRDQEIAKCKNEIKECQRIMKSE